jgi:hypothetical protein
MAVAKMERADGLSFVWAVLKIDCRLSLHSGHSVCCERALIETHRKIMVVASMFE